MYSSIFLAAIGAQGVFGTSLPPRLVVMPKPEPASQAIEIFLFWYQIYLSHPEVAVQLNAELTPRQHFIFKGIRESIYPSCRSSINIDQFDRNCLQQKMLNFNEVEVSGLLRMFGKYSISVTPAQISYKEQGYASIVQTWSRLVMDVSTSLLDTTKMNIFDNQEKLFIATLMQKFNNFMLQPDDITYFADLHSFERDTLKFREVYRKINEIERTFIMETR